MNNRGFSIIELAIVILISGIIVAGFASAYTIYLNKYNFDETNDRVAEAEDALEEFFNTNGRLPCPAPRNVANTSKSYGREVDCTKSASGTKRITGKNSKKVRIGLLPARTLGVSDIYMEDSYGNTLLYAVTENATDEDTYASDGGAIDVVDGSKASLLKDVDYAQYVIISHGPNHEGAYSNAGVLIEECDTDKLESENCDDDATFMDTLRGTAKDNYYYNDIIAYDYQIASSSGQYCPPATIKYEMTTSAGTATCSTPIAGNADGNVRIFGTTNTDTTLLSATTKGMGEVNCTVSNWDTEVYCDNGKWMFGAFDNPIIDNYWYYACLQTTDQTNNDGEIINSTTKSYNEEIIIQDCTTTSTSFSCTGRSGMNCSPKSFAISATIVQ